MTTIIPQQPTRVQLSAILTSPFHHGAGSAGNTSILRTQDVMQPDGTVASVPFLSAASIRHALRDVLAWETARLIGLPYGSITKQSVDLLWSGGAVSATGSRTDLDMIRRVEDAYPALGMLGYAAKSDIITGTLRASDMILVCRENADRLNADPDALHPAAKFRSEEFGTRHDQATSPAGHYIHAAAGEDVPTMQMIWDTQTLMPGSQLAGEITLTPAATDMHITALGAALYLWAPDDVVRLGAKTAQGYGTAILHSKTENGLLVDEFSCYEAWAEHTASHKDDIIALLEELGK